MEETLSTGQAQVSGSETTSQSSAGQSAFSVPEAYASKTWAQDIAKSENPSENLWKMLDNSQSLIGKKVFAPPAEDAPQEEWDKFIGTLRPDSPDKYKFSQVEGLPEGLDLGESQKKAAEIFHKIGITPKQADALYKEYVQDVLGQASQGQAKSAEEKAKLDAQFDKVMTEHFGDKFEEVSQSVQEFVASKVPAELRQHFTKAADNPELLAMFVSSINAAQKEIADVKKKYGAEGDLTSGGTESIGLSIEDVRKELANLRVSKEFKDFTHPENRKVTERVNLLSGIMQKNIKGS